MHQRSDDVEVTLEMIKYLANNALQREYPLFIDAVKYQLVCDYLDQIQTLLQD